MNNARTQRIGQAFSQLMEMVYATEGGLSPIAKECCQPQPLTPVPDKPPTTGSTPLSTNTTSTAQLNELVDQLFGVAAKAPDFNLTACAEELVRQLEASAPAEPNEPNVEDAETEGLYQVWLRKSKETLKKNLGDVQSALRQVEAWYGDLWTTWSLGEGQDRINIVAFVKNYRQYRTISDRLADVLVQLNDVAVRVSLELIHFRETGQLLAEEFPAVPRTERLEGIKWLSEVLTTVLSYIEKFHSMVRQNTQQIVLVSQNLTEHPNT